MATPSNPASQPATGKSVNIRLIILLIILVVGVAAAAHDYTVAQPATAKANTDLEKFASERLGKGVPGGADAVKLDVNERFVRAEDVQKVLGRAPTIVEKFENDQGGHMVEYYFYRPWLPNPKIGKHYVSVVYWNLENPRYMAHFTNTVPPPDSFPDYKGSDEDDRNVVAPPGGPAPGAGGPGPGANPMAGMGGGGGKGDGSGGGKGGGKGRGKGGKRPDAEESSPAKSVEDKPAEEAPAAEATPEKEADKPAETPAAEPATEKPAEEPAAEPAAPAEEKPAAEAPAEEPKATEPAPTEPPATEPAPATVPTPETK